LPKDCDRRLLDRLRIARVELIDEAVGVEPERVGVRAQERARVDATRERVEVVVLECGEVPATETREPLRVCRRQRLPLACRSKVPSDVEQQIGRASCRE